MVPNDYTNKYSLDKLLEKVDFVGRVRMLLQINTISQSMYESILGIKAVRNGFAHRWGDNEAIYKHKPLRDQFEEFKASAEKVWKYLEELYIKEQDKIDIDVILEQIESSNR